MGLNSLRYPLISVNTLTFIKGRLYHNNIINNLIIVIVETSRDHHIIGEFHFNQDNLWEVVEKTEDENRKPRKRWMNGKNETL